ncbi:hypothetical protein JD79_00955 [Geodermatophilus normandii]|uniref:Uncharacterized protein n=1 Tax=Geodermatophilus normandii TaxID=1137989 RepID=A0A317QGB7_9ACTN|nr:hypothetical protein JD79_00955 [Geodermatophilus normandii]
MAGADGVWMDADVAFVPRGGPFWAVVPALGAAELGAVVLGVPVLGATAGGVVDDGVDGVDGVDGIAEDGVPEDGVPEDGVDGVAEDGVVARGVVAWRPQPESDVGAAEAVTAGAGLE